MLGIVLTPFGRVQDGYPFQIDGSGPDYRPHLKPFDPYYQQRGEAGFYSDTPLGQIGLGNQMGHGQQQVAVSPFPTSGPQVRPMSPQGNYTRLTHVHAAAQRALGGSLGAIPTDAELARNLCYTPVHSGWIRTATGFVAPPWTPGYGPGPGLGRAPGLGAEVAPGTFPSASAQLPAGIARIEESPWPRRMFYLSLLSTVAVVTVSAVNLYRSVHGIRRDRLEPER